MEASSRRLPSEMAAFLGSTAGGHLSKRPADVFGEISSRLVNLKSKPAADCSAAGLAF